MSLKNEEEIKEDLILHLAKTVIAASVSARDTIKQVLLILCGTAIPGYLSLLKLYEKHLEKISVPVKLIPIGIWSLILCLTTILIRSNFDFIDFKNPQRIIERHVNSTNKQIRLCVLFIIASCFAIILAAIIIIQGTRVTSF